MIFVPIAHRIIRYRLFALRDQLRTAHYAHDSEVCPETFGLLQTGLNNLINFVPHISLYSMIRIGNFLYKNPTIANKRAEKLRILDNCSNAEVSCIREKTQELFNATIAVNNGMLLLYLFPFVLIAVFAKFLIMKFMNILQEILYIPEKELSGIMTNITPSSLESVPNARRNIGRYATSAR
jgi:hypothetical protein